MARVPTPQLLDSRFLNLRNQPRNLSPQSPSPQSPSPQSLSPQCLFCFRVLICLLIAGVAASRACAPARAEPWASCGIAVTDMDSLEISVWSTVLRGNFLARFLGFDAEFRVESRAGSAGRVKWL